MNFAIATNLDDIKGYATRAGALKVVLKIAIDADFGARVDFRVMVAVNAYGRFIPVAFNIKPELIGTLAHAGIVVVN